MKAVWLVVALVSVAEASPAPRRPPPIMIPFERFCREAGSWEQAQTCIDTHEKGAKVTAMAPEVKYVSTARARHYVFVKFADRWRMAYRPADESYELAASQVIKVGDQPVRRIDLSHHVRLDTTSVFSERVTLVCPVAGNACQAWVTACTVMRRGRAVETFRGELQETAGALSVVGDRTHSGQSCRGR